MSRPRTLPIGLVRIAEVIGEDKAELLGRAIGGVETYIPVRAEADHPLAQVVGFADMEKLCAAFGAQRLDIPRGVYSRMVKAAIHQNPGLSNRQAALQLGCTERYVSMVRNAGKARDDRQGDLF
ncbi:hypothetical protein [Rhodospirillum sp. A1_3_36]|uniref:hypothetical protein n=1 Tax=Rhodospirillum sp. A1_3_36 TaxID=3391666 RepID=UPI0039A67B42